MANYLNNLHELVAKFQNLYGLISINNTVEFYLFVLARRQIV